MAGEIKIVITADGQSAVKVFDQIADGGETMEKALTGASKRVSAGYTQMAGSLKRSAQDVDATNQTVEQSFRDLERGSDRIKLGIAGLGSAFTLYSREIVDNQRQISTLNRIYGDAADGLRAYADQIQDTTIYSSEAAIAAENALGTLALNYGISTDQIQKLLSISTDLAATSGLGLEDVAGRVAAAIRGEAEAAEWLDLTMNQQAIDIDGVTLSMSNQEAALFRVNAMTDQSTFASGAAADQAQTTAGKIRQLGNDFDDAARSVIEFTGPVGEAVAGLSEWGLEAGLTLAAAAKLAQGIGDVSKAFKGVAAADGASAATGSLTKLASAAGSVGLAGALTDLSVAAALTVGPIALVTAGLVGLDLAINQDNKQKINEETDAITAWAASLNDAINPNTRQNLIYLAQDIRDSNAEVSTYAEDGTARVELLADVLDELLSLDTSSVQELEQNLNSVGLSLGNLDGMDMDQLSLVAQYIEGVAYQQKNQAGAAREAATATEQTVNMMRDLDAISYQSAGSIDLSTTAMKQQTDAAAELAEQVAKTAAMMSGDLTIALAGLVGDDVPGQVIQQWRDMMPELNQILAQLATSLTGEQLADVKIDLATAISNPEQIDYVISALHDLDWALANDHITAEQYATAIDTIVTVTLPNLDAQSTLAAASVTDLSAAMMTLQGAVVAAFSSDLPRIFLDGIIEMAPQVQGTIDQLIADGISGKALTEVSNSLAAITAAPGQSGEKARRDLAVLMDLMASEQITAEQFSVVVNATAASLGSMGLQAQYAGLVIKSTTNPALAEMADLAGGTTHRVIDLTRQGAKASIGLSEIGDAAKASTEKMEAFNRALKETATATAGYSTSLQDMQSLGFASPELDLAVNLQISQNSLDNVNRVIVGQTNAMSQQLGGVKSWADQLIGDPGTWSDLDRLKADHRLGESDEENQAVYDAAQAAQVNIARDVGNAQEDLLAIQAKLAPVMADAVRQQAEYIDGLQNMDADSQLAALGMMDQATSTKAINLANLAASATTEQMANSTELLIQKAADADPALRAVLESMGLIDDKGAVVDIDTSQADGAKSSTDRLIESVDALTLALGGVPPSVNTDIIVTDLASGIIENVKMKLYDLDGDSATVYIKTEGGLLPGVVLGEPGNRNGGIVGYANGGMVMAQLAEAGPELLRFANGGQAVVPNPGIYAVEVGTSVLPAPATNAVLSNAARSSGRGSGDIHIHGTVVIQPATSDVDSAIRRKLLSSTRR